MSEAHKATSFSGTSCQTPILVTGATGFLGGYVSRRLQAGGAAVRALGRHLARGQQLQSEGIAFYPVDLRDREAVIRACAGVAAVVHAGALSSAWGRYQDFYDCNVRGTEHVIEGCLRHGVRRLVYISSPSILSRLTDQHDLDECAPFPPSFVSVYSETKKLGEDRVRAVRNKLETVILRPKAIYGPGDNALLPRLIDAARRGRLPIIGDGNTVTEVTHVDDVVQAVLLALEKPEAAGQTFLITSGEDTRIWDLIRDVTLQLGYAPPAKRLPVRKALLIAAVMEGVWRGLRLPGEPLLTRYKAGILGYSQTYSIDKARRELGYCPKVTLKAGMPGALAALATEPKHMGGPVVSVEVRHGRQTHFRAPCPAPASGQGMAPSATPEGTLVKLRMLKAGSTHAPEKVFTPYGRWRWIYVPAMFALLEHPSEGVGLVDVGYAPRFFEATRRWPYRIFRWLTPAAIPETESPVVQLRQRGIGPEEVRWILISHFDPDHIGGLIDFPAARLYCSVEAFASIRGKHGWRALRIRLLPELLPADLAARVELLPDFTGPAVGPFEHTHDLFGDGSILLAPLPGHAAGQVGALVNTVERGRVFLVVDGCWNRAALRHPEFRGGLHRYIAVSRPAQDETYRKLQAFTKEFPEVPLIPAHCPEAWAEFSGGV